MGRERLDFSSSAGQPSVSDLNAVQSALQRREEWLRLAAQGSQLGLWYWNEVTRELFWDAKTREMFGVPVDDRITLETFYRALHPDDLRQVRTTWRDVFERGLPYDIEYRSHRPDGTIRWINARGRGYYDEAGTPLCMLGVVFDITERKEFERERLELSGRLIQAQEDERTRLARDLHDDLGQQMAIISGELELVLDVLDSRAKASQRLRKLLERVKGIGAHVQSLSHSLHSSRLEILSLSQNVRSLCREFSALHKIPVHCNCTGIPESIPLDLKVGLFRIVQEALHNVNKHSRASRVEVRLSGSPSEIYLTVCDNGVGIDLSRSHTSTGIGILSMKERARMLHGTFDVRSAPMKGTQITLNVPLKHFHAAA